MLTVFTQIWRRGIPIVAARAWSGSRGPKLDLETIDESIDFLSARAPGQNLDRNLASEPISSGSNSSAAIFTWSASTAVNEDNTNATTSIGQGSKGMNHTLYLNCTGPFTLSSPDVTLSLDASGKLVYTSDGWPYPLRSVSESDGFDPGHPGRIWWNVSSSSHDEVTLPMEGGGSRNIIITTTAVDGSRVWVDGKWSGRFEVFVFGGRNTLFSWSQMAFVAPLETAEGNGLKGLSVWDGVRSVDEVMTAMGGPAQSGPGTYTPSNGTSPARGGEGWMLVVLIGVFGAIWML